MLALGRPAVGSCLLRPRIGADIQPEVRPRGLDSLIAFRAPALRCKILAPFGRARLLPVRFPVSGSRTDFEFVQLVPLFIGAIPLGDGKKFAYPAARIYG